MTETGCKVLFTAYDDDEENRAELPREHLRIPYLADEEGDEPTTFAYCVGEGTLAIQADENADEPLQIEFNQVIGGD